MAVNAFEENINYSEIRKYADKHFPQRSGVLSWLIHVMCHFMGFPSTYDYAARVGIAEESLNRINPFYKAASKLTLEEILINLTPKPDTVQATTFGVDTNSPDSLSLKGDITPLNDDSIQETGLVELRYSLLKRALALYVEIGLEALREEMKEEENLDYMTYFNRNLGNAKKSAEELAHKRASLYTDFPPEKMRSVSEEVLINDKAKATIREELRATKLGIKISADLGSLETKIRASLRGILTKARKSIGEFNQKKQKYINAAKNIDFVKNAIAPNISEDVINEIDEELKAFVAEVTAHFNPEEVIPEDVFSDLKSHAKVYKEGEL